MSTTSAGVGRSATLSPLITPPPVRSSRYRKSILMPALSARHRRPPVARESTTADSSRQKSRTSGTGHGYGLLIAAEARCVRDGTGGDSLLLAVMCALVQLRLQEGPGFHRDVQDAAEQRWPLQSYGPDTACPGTSSRAARRRWPWLSAVSAGACP